MTDSLIKVDDDNLKKIQLEVLSSVASFCVTHDINYWLDFGTLIGAIRHKGYIPWDDDIDISMSREDYIKFTRFFNNENTRYRFMCYDIDRTWPYPFGKVLDTETVLYEPDESGYKLSINIDVFPYDEAPNSNSAKKLCKKSGRYCLFQTAKLHKGRAKGNVFRRMAVACLKVIAKLFPRDYFIKRIDRNAKKYYNCDTEYLGYICDNTKPFVFDKKIFADFIEAEFEGKAFKIPRNYDEVLHKEFGDYMQFPPASEQVSHHKFKAYIKDFNTEKGE